MYYDKDIDKYKCGPAVTMLSDVASPNAERTSSVLLLIYSCYYIGISPHVLCILIISTMSRSPSILSCLFLLIIKVAL